MRMLIISLMLAFSLYAPYCIAATYYIDYIGGSDENNGTSDSTPWKHLPFDSSFTGSYSGSNGDDFYFKKGVTYYSTGRTGDLFEISITGASDNYVIFGAYGTGTNPIITGGMAIDYSQFGLVSGTPGTDAIYRATNTSLGLTGISVLGVYEAGYYDTFTTYSEIYSDQGSASLSWACRFYQTGTGADDYLYIRTGSNGAPVEGMDLHIAFMGKCFDLVNGTTSRRYYQLEDLTIWGFTDNATTINGYGSHTGYGLVFDTVDIRQCHSGIYATNTPVHIDTCNFLSLSVKGAGYAVGYAAINTDIASLIEDSIFKRAGRNPIYIQSTSALPATIRRCFFMDTLIDQTDETQTEELQHAIRFTAGDGNEIYVYRCIFYNVGSDCIFDQGVEPQTTSIIHFWNNTIYEGQSYDYGHSTIGIQTLMALDMRNCVVRTRQLEVYASYGELNLEESNIDYNYYIYTGTTDLWRVTFDEGGSSYTETLATWQSNTNSAGYQQDTNSASTTINNDLDVFQSITYGTAGFLQPKTGGVLHNTGVSIMDGENEITYNSVVIASNFDLGAYDLEADETAPTVSTAIIPAVGNTAVITLSEDVTTTAGSGWTISCTGGKTGTFSSETGGVLTFTIPQVLSTDTCTYSYVPATGDTVDASANEVDTITDAEVDNQSAYLTSTAGSFEGAGPGSGGSVTGLGAGSGGRFN